MTLNLPRAMQRAVAAYQRGEWTDAERLCRIVLGAQPDCFPALQVLGTIAVQTHRPEEALDLLTRAVAANPRDAGAHLGRGNALRALKRHEEALASYERAVALAPGLPEAHNNCGNVLRDLGRHAQALSSYERSLSLGPRFAEAWVNRGNVLRELGRCAEALESYDRAIALRADDARAHGYRGLSLAELGRTEEAVASYDRAIALRADDAQAHGNRGASLILLRRYAQALESHDRAIALSPGDAEVHCSRGVALAGLQRHAEALASYDRAIALKPDYADAHNNRGMALVELHRHAEALASYDRAIALRPDYASAHFNRSVLRLLTGDLAAGWAEFEWRWKERQLAGHGREFDRPLWLGSPDLEGRTILLHAEQGLGDTLQFCRYAARVAALGATVVLEVPPPLVPLLEGLEGATTVLAAGAPLPEFDCHCPLLSLPQAFGIAAHDIPASIPYIRADRRRVAAWRQRLGEKTRPRLGLAWSGNAMHANDRNRSIALAQMLPLLCEGVEFVSLQKELREADAEVLASSEAIRHFGGELKDFADTAALLELMDAVIAVDTGVAHLAGAMGKPQWILLPFNPDWRWQLDREDSPWYPTARLIRQPAFGDWGSVIRRLRGELDREFCARRGTDRS